MKPRKPSPLDPPHRTPFRRTARNFALFFSFSHHNFHSFYSLLGVFSLKFSGVFEDRDPKMCTCGVLGLSCEAPAAPSWMSHASTMLRSQSGPSWSGIVSYPSTLRCSGFVACGCLCLLSHASCRCGRLLDTFGHRQAACREFSVKLWHVLQPTCLCAIWTGWCLTCTMGGAWRLWQKMPLFGGVQLVVAVR